VVRGRVGGVKTEVSRKLVPLHPEQLEALQAWREESPYPDDDDWVFASHRMQGLKPYYPDMMLKRHVRRTADRLGIEKRIGWHTFRRSYAFMLKANGEDVKVVQELLRLANPRITLELYAQAYSDDARRAQNRVVEMVRKASLPRHLQAKKNGGRRLMCTNVPEWVAVTGCKWKKRW
jgi:integrase